MKNLFLRENCLDFILEEKKRKISFNCLMISGRGGGKKKKNISALFSSFYRKGEKNLTEVSHTGSPPRRPAFIYILFPFLTGDETFFFLFLLQLPSVSSHHCGWLGLKELIIDMCHPLFFFYDFDSTFLPRSLCQHCIPLFMYFLQFS